MVEAPIVQAPVSADGDSANPFRSKSGAAELPLPPQARDFAPTQSEPPKTPPVQLIPAQPTPIAPPALEKVPQETAPAANKPVTEQPAEKTTTVATVSPKTPAEPLPIAPIILVEALMPLPMPVVPTAVKMPSAAPMLVPPQNGEGKPSVETPNPKLAQASAAPKTEKENVEKPTTIPTAKDHGEDPAMSERVEQHLLNNLRL
jgi:hypothetical protein